MAVDSEAEVGIKARIDDSHAVFLPGFEVEFESFTSPFAAGVGCILAVEDVGAIDECGLLCWWSVGWTIPPPLVEGVDMCPILQE